VTVAPNEIEVNARMFPAKVVLVPRVAEGQHGRGGSRRTVRRVSSQEIRLERSRAGGSKLRKMRRVGWEALGQWGEDAARIEPLAGGVANDVWRVRVNGHVAVGRLGARSAADLAWETGLLRYLDREGLTVPVPIPTADGRLFADGLVVMTYLEGGPPETQADWRRVAGTLRELHRLTRGWPQRPGWRSSTDLLHAETGTKIDLGAMPAEGVARCRAAWARLVGRQTCVVHGDPNPGNVRMTADRVALIDWDEAHVDVPDLDLVLPDNAAGLDDSAYDIAAQASAAWEAAVCWDDEYAAKRLAEVRAV
jgi:Ser/Thr protein kinase RdoA (MazF antagonist)